MDGDVVAYAWMGMVMYVRDVVAFAWMGVYLRYRVCCGICVDGCG